MARQTFTAGQVLTSAQMLTLQNSVWSDDVNPQVGSYTLVLTDAGKQVTVTSSSTTVFTVPPNSAVAFDIGVRIQVINLGTASTTLTQGSGVTISSVVTSLVLVQYQMATLIKTGTNTWVADISSTDQIAYTSYTPTISGWTQGNATFPVSVYSTNAKLVNAQGHFLFGTTSAVTSSPLKLSLPVNATSNTNSNIFGVCSFNDISASAVVTGYCRIQNDTDLFFYWHDPETTPLAVRMEAWTTSVTLPFTFATGDIVSWNIIYQRS